MLKKIAPAALVLAITVLAGSPSHSWAADWTPVRLTLWPNRLEFPRASVVRGLNVGPLAARSDAAYGLQVSPVYSRSKDITGLQLGAVAITDSLTGVQAGLFSGAQSVRGLQVGAFAGAGSEERDGRFAGLQLGGLNVVLGELAGLQVGFVNGVGNRTGGIRKGGQVGFVNSGPLEGIGYSSSDGGSLKGEDFPNIEAGFQLGAWNTAGQIRRGAQIGVFNFCRELKGVQVGLINIASKGGLLPFTLILNVGR